MSVIQQQLETTTHHLMMNIIYLFRVFEFQSSKSRLQSGQGTILVGRRAVEHIFHHLHSEASGRVARAAREKYSV